VVLSHALSGHYTAFVRGGDSNTVETSADNWLFCNDSSVSPAATSEIVSSKYVRMLWCCWRCLTCANVCLASFLFRAYVLFYKRRHLSVHNIVKYGRKDDV
jgi:hypothetical protein